MPLVSLRDVSIRAGYVEKLPVSMWGVGFSRRRYLILRKMHIDWYEKEEDAESAFAEELDLTAAESRRNRRVRHGSALFVGYTSCTPLSSYGCIIVEAN